MKIYKNIKDFCQPATVRGGVKTVDDVTIAKGNVEQEVGWNAGECEEAGRQMSSAGNKNTAAK